MKLAYIRCNHRIYLEIYICYGIKNYQKIDLKNLFYKFL